MAEYIEREAAIEKLNKLCDRVCQYSKAQRKYMCGACPLGDAFTVIEDDIPAADAIEELSKPKWIVFETRPMDDEERQYYSEQYGFGLADEEAVIYCSQMPDHGQEVLVCNEYGQIWIDTFDDDPDYGVGFETNGDMDGLVAWMPLPKPYEPSKEVRNCDT